MIYYKIICWNECPFCLRAKVEMIERKVNFEYCSVDHSNVMLDYYKSIYNHKTVPMVVGGYTDLIKYFTKENIKAEIPPPND